MPGVTDSHRLALTAGDAAVPKAEVLATGRKNPRPQVQEQTVNNSAPRLKESPFLRRRCATCDTKTYSIVILNMKI